MTIITGALHTDQYTVMITPSSVLPRVKNISDKIVEKI
jgi:hypothetical protein